MSRQGPTITLAIRVVIFKHRWTRVYHLSIDPDGFVVAVTHATETSFIRF